MKFGFITVAAAIPSVKVADTEYNIKQIEDFVAQAEGRGVEIIVFPELSVTGYSCQDLFLQQLLVEQAEVAVMQLLDFSRKLDIICIVGAPVNISGSLYNCAVVIQHGVILGIIPKTYLPNYGEFYEKRWFTSSKDLKPTDIRYAGNSVSITPGPTLFRTSDNALFGVEICEDVWAAEPCSNKLALAGADIIYKVGGSQAIAALAYGTETIPQVDKIVGPGNIYVALAKKQVYGNVSIDSIAGPSEIAVLADETANPRYVAADLLSQAEHDELASAILVTTSEAFAKEVEKEIEGFLKELSRAEIIQKSLDQFGYLLVAETMDQAIETVNAIASEHLEVVTANPFDVMTKIRNAGAIFIGEYSSEPLGDYFAGPNHVLPTNGTAKFFSPLSVDDFIKKSSIIYYSKEALEPIHKDIEAFAEAEQLTAHANSIKVRFDEQ